MMFNTCRYLEYIKRYLVTGAAPAYLENSLEEAALKSFTKKSNPLTHQLSLATIIVPNVLILEQCRAEQLRVKELYKP